MATKTDCVTPPVYIFLTDRTRQSFVGSTLGYPEVQRGRSTPLPPYESLEDPHLSEYFERRFGNIQYVARVSTKTAKSLFYLCSL